MQTSLLIIGIMLALASHWQHHRVMNRLQQRGSQLKGQLARNHTIYHGLLYLGVLYVALGLWHPTWLNARVLGLLSVVNAVAIVVGWYQRRQHHYPAASRRLWHQQAWYLLGSQLLLAAVLLGTLLSHT
ncbi:hypothetical protein [Levilactobacillus wangkuiensis]|uniref:hypothetical protein n=1 Tax=Levilactobacillus wangkuiensis TaxID=2799566 RepID=UPI00194392F3|nr:hypothetical protein [Levilactobacillus wangkuiensis]